MFHSGLSLISFRNHSRIRLSSKMLTFNYILFHSEITVVIFNAISSGFWWVGAIKRCIPWSVLRPKPAAGVFSFSPLHSRAALRSATLRSIPFIVSPSLGYPRKSASFIPLRSGQPTVSFRSPLALQPTTRNSKPKREASFHPTQFATLHSVTTLAFPHANQRYALRRVCPGKQKPQIPHSPLMVAP